MEDVNQKYYMRFMFRAVLSNIENNDGVVSLLAS